MISNSRLACDFWERGRSASCPIYDMHGHMGPWSAIYFSNSQFDRRVERAWPRNLRKWRFRQLFGSSGADSRPPRGHPLSPGSHIENC